jgi:hypothetical protein
MIFVLFLFGKSTTYIVNDRGFVDKIKLKLKKGEKMKPFVMLSMLIFCASAWTSEPNELEKLRFENAELKRVCEKLRQNAVKLRLENKEQSQTGGELQKNTTEQQNKIRQLEAKNAKQKEQIDMLQKQVEILYKLCKDANTSISIPDNLKPNTVFRKDITGLRLPLSVGQIGQISVGGIVTGRLRQVIDENNMLATLSFYTPAEVRYNSSGVRYIEGERSLISTKILWIKGIKTSGFADDTPLKIENI